MRLFQASRRAPEPSFQPGGSGHHGPVFGGFDSPLGDFGLSRGSKSDAGDYQSRGRTLSVGGAVARASVHVWTVQTVESLHVGRDDAADDDLGEEGVALVLGGSVPEGVEPLEVGRHLDDAGGDAGRTCGRVLAACEGVGDGWGVALQAADEVLRPVPCGGTLTL